MAKSKQKIKPKLSELENSVMSVLWQLSEATAEKVRLSLKTSPKLKDSTIRTILKRLENKGYVEHRTEKRTYVYSPTEDSRDVAAEAVEGIIERFCNGSLENLLVGMVDREVVSPDKLEALAKKIAKARAGSGRKSKRSDRKGK
jgi:predicted transcriptional regulator